MKVVSFVNGKGGVGKTTLCINLAKGFVLEDDDPLSITLVDADAQGSLRAWHERIPEGAEDDRINVIAADTKASLLNVTRAVSANYIFIDTPGNIHELHAVAIRVADMVVIPITPSYFDVRATIDDTVDLVRSACDINPNIKPVIVINLVDPRVKYDKEIGDLLKHLTDFYISDARICLRQPFKSMSKIGRTIFDEKDKEGRKGKDEILALSRDLLDHLYQRRF